MRRSIRVISEPECQVHLSSETRSISATRLRLVVSRFHHALFSPQSMFDVMGFDMMQTNYNFALSI